ncbi:HNH endonuclease [Streptomyces sp. ID05-04B]|uniref:HNH endonuclease n=1 Tax=Streptomyces sp. ID05-04B TaxID=3028661 RepID=UPI0029CA1710|nr:HNH endonuclease [Streptomyces sp. ID05-04B]
MPRNQRSLSDQQAQWVLQSIAGGHVTRAEAAEELGVSRAVIDGIVGGRSYRHLSRPTPLPLPRPRTYRGSAEAPERRALREAQFWTSVDTSPGEAECWPFLGPLNIDGYGQYYAGRTLIGTVSAHRVAYVLAHGLASNLPAHRLVRHLCANPRCCNPAHLTVGSQRDNMTDRFRLHRNRPGPHPVRTLTPPPPGGWRVMSGDLKELARKALEAEFWRKIDRSGSDTACWPWMAASRHDFGYGFVYWEGRHTQAARVAYVLHHGLTLACLGSDLVVRHLCPGGSNPGCCNPHHLKVGTQKQNMHDRLAEGKYERGDDHFATKVSNREVRALREEYWNAPHGKRPKLEVLAQRHGVYWGTIHRWLRGAGRQEAGGPTGELEPEAEARTNHARGEAHRMVKISDARVRELRETYWNMPTKQRPSTVSLAARLGTDSKTVWNWLHGKSRLSAGGPTSDSVENSGQQSGQEPLPDRQS